MSFGREVGTQDGQIVYIVVYWMNENKSHLPLSQHQKDQIRSCIVFRTFDMKLNTDLLNKKDI